MIVCPRCATGLGACDDGFACPSCSYRAVREEGIIVFEPRPPGVDGDGHRSDGLDMLFRHEQSHPWFVRRLQRIRETFAAHVGRHEEVLEIGAGTGRTAWALREDGYVNVSLGERNARGLAYAKQHGFAKLYQFDLCSSPFRDHFDVVALFDVLEHIEDDAHAVRRIRDMLRPGGRVILTVPAHRWLWSRIDELSGHCRRYSRTGLMSLVMSAGFEVVECRYLFSGLVPGLLVRALLAHHATWETVEERSGLHLSRSRTALLKLALRLGDTLLFPLRNWTGASLLAVARKRTGGGPPNVAGIPRASADAGARGEH